MGHEKSMKTQPNVKAHKALGNSQEAKTLNLYLKTLEQKVYDFHYLMLKEENFVTAESLKSKLLGTGSPEILFPVLSNQKMNSYLVAIGVVWQYLLILKYSKKFLDSIFITPLLWF